MGRRLVGVVGVWSLACAALVAADFWEQKPFMTWSDKELLAIMSDSPWAQKLSVVVQPPPMPGGDEGGRGGAPGGGAPGGGGEGGGGGRSAFPTILPQLKLTVSWRSALPLKQAATREEFGLDGAVSTERQELLERSERFYVVTVTGLPLAYRPLTGKLKDETVLKREGKAAISPSEVLVQPQEGMKLLLVFAFPKDDVISLEDKQVELFTKLGFVEIKKKFNLKTMVFKGKLEL